MKASLPRSVSRSSVQEIAKRGVRIGCTRGSWFEAIGPGGKARICDISSRTEVTETSDDGST